MLDEILTNIIELMSKYLNEEQLKELQNTLYIQFHGFKIIKENYEITPTGNDNDENKLKLFAISKKISGRQQKTIEQYIREARNLRNTIGKEFSDITTMDLRWYFGILQQKNHNSMVTIQNKMRYLNSFYDFMTTEGFIKENPVRKIEALKLQRKIKHELSSKEIESMRLSCKRIRDRALLEFFLSTGVRVSELCSLNIRDIDLYKQEFIVMGKGRKERRLYITDTCAFHLFRYLKERKEIEKINDEELNNKPLFINIKKPYKRITPAGVQSILKEIGKNANVNNVHPHRLRRTFATDLLNKGMRLEEVMILMGHTKPETTLIYCNIKQDSVRESFKKISIT